MIVFVCSGQIGFPNGTAPTGRVTSYARGLVELGAQVLVLCINFSDIPAIGVLNTQVRGNVRGIEFEYTCGTTVRSDSFILRRWHTLKGAIVAAKRIFALSRRKGVEAILLYPDRTCSSLWFWLIARICRAPLILEKNEKPFYGFKQKGWRKPYTYCYLQTIYRLFDGIIVISDYLCTYMRQYMRPQAKLLKIPILVDTDLFAPAPGNRRAAEQYIAYCGTLNETKDGVHTLMKAFASICGQYPEFKLLLIGDSYQRSQIPQFKAHAEEMGIADRVIFTGTVSRSKLPELIGSATILALARPDSPQVAAGFPSKIAEYLATGNPVVLTRTGELHRYLEDGKSAYFVPPNDLTAFAERLKHVLSNPVEAREVGMRGRSVAKNFFDYRVNAKHLYEFIMNCQTAR